MADLQLGIAGLSPLPEIAAEPDRWDALWRRLHATVFLRSEANVVTLGVPQRARGPLVEEAREVVARFDRFYAHAARAYYDRPALRPEFLVNPLLDPLIELDRDRREASATPVARLDAVLSPGGALRVIEINPVGVNLLHLRGLLYLIRGLDRAGLEGDARLLDTLTAGVVDAFARPLAARRGRTPARPRLGSLTMSGWFRAAQRLYRAAFRRHGWDYVWGGPEALQVDAEGVRLAGEPVDVLWPDFLFYNGYQAERYSQTRFPSHVGDFMEAPAPVAAIMADRRFLEHARAGRVVVVSPGIAYLCLSKSLLAWIHDPERPVPPEDRAWLQAHVTRTFAARDRRRGALTREQVIDEKDRFLIKPCQYGGAHGVRAGIDCERDAWAALVDPVWDDDTWVVQDFAEPARVAGGEWLSVGLADHGGVLGGIYLRTEARRVISARSARFIPVVIE